jgi:polar amino acid transport system substrate-binding protein
MLIYIIFSLNLVAKEPLIVSLHPSAHPYGWHKDKELKGASFELIKLIAKDLDIEIKPIILPWARSIEDVKSGKIDIILTAFYTKDRAIDISFSTPYDEVVTSVFVAKDSDVIFNEPNDLKGLVGLTIVGDSQGDKWDKFEKEHLNVLRVVNMEQVFKMLVSKRADYVVFPKISTIREVKIMGYDDKIEPLPTPITSQGVYFGISKKSKYHKYLDLINQKIEKYKKDGTYAKFIDKAFEEQKK